jgi:hypothetical protein
MMNAPLRGKNTGVSVAEGKFEYLNPKFQTIPNDRNPNDENWISAAWSLNFDIVLNIETFVFRIFLLYNTLKTVMPFQV